MVSWQIFFDVYHILMPVKHCDMNGAMGDSALEAWQKHVLACEKCGVARNGQELCQVGQNAWRVPGSATLPMTASATMSSATASEVVSGPVLLPEEKSVMHVQSRPTPAPFDLSGFAARVADRVIARASSGAEVAIPRQKTSRAVSFSTAPGVVLHMPERDIEVYSAMRLVIPKLLSLANMLGLMGLVAEEAKNVGRQSGMVLDEAEVALVVSKAAETRGVGGMTSERLYQEFDAVVRVVMSLGDVIGRFMTVDEETRAVMRQVRMLGVEMQSELERAAGGRLIVDGELRRTVKALRMVSVALQSEIDRRLGT